MLVKYEALVGVPKNTIEKISSFLEIDFESRMFDTSLNSDAIGQGEQEWKGNAEKSISATSVNRFISGLTKDEIEFLTCIMRNHLKQNGYSVEQFLPQKMLRRSIQKCRADLFLLANTALLKRFREAF